MKILYGAGKHPGANIQLSRFLQDTKHDVRIAAYIRNSNDLLYIDWTLDALQGGNGQYLYTYFGHHGIPRIQNDKADTILTEVGDWHPDLIISDAEPIVAHIAQSLDVDLWYCSSLLLLDAVSWEKRPVFSKGYRFSPPACRNLVYSPFCDVAMRPVLKPEYNWCRPYTELSTVLSTTDLARAKHKSFKYILRNLRENQVLTTGETSLVADAFYDRRYIYVSPIMSDLESAVNAELCDRYFIGSNLGEIETSLAYVKSAFDNSHMPREDYLSIQNWNTLEQEIDEVYSA